MIHFTLCLIFIRVCPKEDPPFEIRQITRTIYYICCSVHTFIKIFIENSCHIKYISSYSGHWALNRSQSFPPILNEFFFFQNSGTRLSVIN